MRRRIVPLVMVPAGREIVASYVGYPWKTAHIKLSIFAAEFLTKEEVGAVVLHEVGHRELYHVERQGVFSVAYALAVTAASFYWWPAIVALFLFLQARAVHQLWLEVEADWYAVGAAGLTNMRKSLTKVAEHQKITRRFDYRLRIFILFCRGAS